MIQIPPTSLIHIPHMQVIIETATACESPQSEKGWFAWGVGRRRSGLFPSDYKRAPARVANKRDNDTAETKTRTTMSGRATERSAFVRDPLIALNLIRLCNNYGICTKMTMMLLWTLTHN